MYLGQVALQQSDYALAEKVLRRIRRGDYYFDAQITLTQVIRERQGVEAALKHLREVASVNDREKVRIYLGQEQLLRENEDRDGAKKVLDQALVEFPDNPELLYARGLLAASLKLIELHERDLRRLLSFEPDNAHALNALGYTLTDLTDRHQEAYELLLRAIELKPDDPFVLDSMGWVHYRLGNHELALNFLERAIKIRVDAEISAHLGEVLWETGNTVRARKIWQGALEQSPDNDVLLETIDRYNAR